MTTKKRGRGRPKKTDKTAEKIPVAKYLEGARKSLDIKTEEVALSNNLKLARDLGAQKPIREEVQTVMEADFRIVIDNETAEKDVRFLQNGDQGLALVMLAEHYLENFEFNQFINSIVIEAARQKTTNLTVELRSIFG